MNIWPQTNVLNIPIDAMEVYIIALSKTKENAYSTCPVNLETRDSLVNNQNNDQQLGQQSSLAVNHYSFGRPGNSVISLSNFGKRSLFNCQKRVSGTPAPSKQNKSAKLQQVLKNMTVSDVQEHEYCPKTICNVPIDLIKLDNKNSNFTKFDLQKEVSQQVDNFSDITYILTDKKGNPTRDMPNTRDMKINYFQYYYFV